MEIVLPGVHNERYKRKTGKIPGFHPELRKLSNMKVTVIPIIVGVLETVPKTLTITSSKFEKELRVTRFQYCKDLPES